MTKKHVRRKSNRGEGTSSYMVHDTHGLRGKQFGYLKSARAYAQKIADETGRSVQISKYAGKGSSKGSVTVYPKMVKNPTAALPRGKWINAKIRVTKSGKIQAKIKR